MGDLLPLAPIFEQARCASSCEIEDWRIQSIIAPPGTRQKITSTDKLFQITGKMPNYCGSAGCVEAYVLRDATGLRIVKAGYAISRVSPLVAADIPSPATRGSLPTVQRAATNTATVAGWNLGKQAFARDILNAYSNDLAAVNRVADNADYAILAWAAYVKDAQASAVAAKERGWVPFKTYLIENKRVGDTVATLFLSEDRKAVLAFRGTESPGDWMTNTLGVVSFNRAFTRQVQEARSLAMEIVATYPDAVFVGHSLGGRLAQAARLSTGNRAVVFNSAFLSLDETLRALLFPRNSAAPLHLFRSPDDPLTEFASTSTTTIQNIERTGQTIRGNTLNSDFTHSIGVMATAMQNVRIARDGGWISNYISGVAPQPVPASTPQPPQENASVASNGACPQLGGGKAKTAADCATLALADIASAVEKLSTAKSEGKISGALGQAMSELMARNPQAESMQLGTCKRLGNGGANELASAACLALVWSRNQQVRREASDMFDKVVDDLNSAMASKRLPLTNVPPVYVVKGACPGDGCKFGMWTATGTRPLFESPGAQAVAAQLVRGERVAALRGEVHVRPVKGVVSGRIDHLKQGETVYLMDYAGEGLSNTWARGQVFADPRGNGGCTPTPVCKTAIRYPVDKAPYEWWVRVQKRDGQSGWMRPDVGPAFYGTSWTSAIAVAIPDPYDVP